MCSEHALCYHWFCRYRNQYSRLPQKARPVMIGPSCCLSICFLGEATEGMAPSLRSTVPKSTLNVPLRGSWSQCNFVWMACKICIWIKQIDKYSIFMFPNALKHWYYSSLLGIETELGQGKEKHLFLISRLKCCESLCIALSWTGDFCKKYWGPDGLQACALGIQCNWVCQQCVTVSAHGTSTDFGWYYY